MGDENGGAIAIVAALIIGGCTIVAATIDRQRFDHSQSGQASTVAASSNAAGYSPQTQFVPIQTVPFTAVPASHAAGQQNGASAPTKSPTPTPSPSPSPSPSPTPSPSPAIPPTPTDTPDGKVLDVNQTWRQGGLTLTLTNANIHGTYNVQGVAIAFQLHSERDQSFKQTFTEENISAVDNNGKRLPVFIDFGGSSGPSDVFECGYIVDPGKSYPIPWSTCNVGSYWYFVSGMTIQVDVSLPSLNQITLSVSFSSISNARWKIPVYH